VGKTFRADIQGLRAIAVLLVVLYHSGVAVLSGGYVGVDVFFVISGFLITGHIWSELQAHGRLRFAKFYARRARRILPASFVVLFLTLVASLIWVPPLHLPAMLRGAVATALYVPNVFFANEDTDYLSETAPSVYQHYWSLGVEEQFYLLWPLLMALAFLWTRRSLRGVAAALTAIVLLSLVCSVVVTGISQPNAFFMLPTRAWELGVGGVLALLVAAAPRWLDAKLLPLVGWLGLGMILVSALAYTSQTSFPGWQAALPVVGTALVILAGTRGGRHGPARILSIPPAQFLGKISYSLYLVHWPLQVIPQEAAGIGNALPLWGTLALGVAAVPLAWLSWKYVEEPSRTWRFLVAAHPRRSLTAALGASLVVVVFAAGASLSVASMQLSDDREAPQARSITSPAGTAFVPANVQPTLRGVAGDNPEIYANGCHRNFESVDAAGCQIGENSDAPLIALFGDSHAANWYPPLAELASRGDIRLDVNTKSSCASAMMAKPEYPACETWRDAVIERLAIEEPELVLLANYGRGELATDGQPAASWREALGATVDALQSSSDVVILLDTPRSVVTPSVCLSAHLHNTAHCDIPLATALDPDIRGVEETLDTGYVDFVDYLCNGSACPTVIGNALVYRDAHHLTATFARSLSDVMAEKLLPHLEGYAAKG
jgi:peptidoglycan/LPS O-acetylase OafA/YrhL